MSRKKPYEIAHFPSCYSAQQDGITSFARKGQRVTPSNEHHNGCHNIAPPNYLSGHRCECVQRREAILQVGSTGERMIFWSPLQCRVQLGLLMWFSLHLRACTAGRPTIGPAHLPSMPGRRLRTHRLWPGQTDPG